VTVSEACDVDESVMAAAVSSWVHGVIDCDVGSHKVATSCI
jgi:hypothetical protein